MIHPLSDCNNSAIPESTSVWQFCVMFPGARIGEDRNICSHCLIENDVVIGNNVTVKCGVQVWDGIKLEDGVMVGANTTFTNDMYPRLKNREWELLKAKVCKGASIGAGTTILPDLVISESAMIGAGNVVTESVPAGEIWVGNPAKFLRKIDEQ